jgi:hypothetical protein
MPMRCIAELTIMIDPLRFIRGSTFCTRNTGARRQIECLIEMLGRESIERGLLREARIGHDNVYDAFLGLYRCSDAIDIFEF